MLVLVLFLTCFSWVVEAARWVAEAARSFSPACDPSWLAESSRRPQDAPRRRSTVSPRRFVSRVSRSLPLGTTCLSCTAPTWPSTCSGGAPHCCRRGAHPVIVVPYHAGMHAARGADMGHRAPLSSHLAFDPCTNAVPAMSSACRFVYRRTLSRRAPRVCWLLSMVSTCCVERIGTNLSGRSEVSLPAWLSGWCVWQQET